MPDANLAAAVPPHARWVKVHYRLKPKKPGAELIARLWSGEIKDAVVIKGESGDAFVKLNNPQTLSYQVPATVDLEIKVTAYKS